MTTIAAALKELMPHFPVGFGFRPTDEEVIHYLNPKILGKDDPQVCVIPEFDVYKKVPRELPSVFAGLSVIKSNDPDWWFLCPRDSKHRKTKSGFWKKTGNDVQIKARGTNNLIGTKKFLLFYEGRVSNGIKTDWVMHEYHLLETLPNQRTFVICRIMNKAYDITNVSTCDEGEPSSNTIPEPETELGFQPHDCDFSSSQQFMNNQQQPFLENISFAHASINEWTMVESEFDLIEQEKESEFNLTELEKESEFDLTEQEKHEFVDSLITVTNDYSCPENMHPSVFKDSSTSESLRKVYYGDGGISSDTDTDRAQAPAEDAAKHNTTVDLQQKEKSIMEESEEEWEMAEGSNAKKILKSTADESASSNRNGSPLRHEYRLPSESFINVVLLLGIVFFAVFVKEVVLFRKWC